VGVVIAIVVVSAGHAVPPWNVTLRWLSVTIKFTTAHRMRNMTDRNEMITAAHELDGGKNANNELYRRWAHSYDKDVLGDGYGGRLGGAVMARRVAASAGPGVLGVGCGTGVGGVELAARMR